MILAAMLVITVLLAGCTGNNGADNTVQNGDGAETTAETGSDKPLGKFDPPIEVTSITRTEQQTWLEGDSVNNNPHTRWALDELGMKITYTLQPASDDQLKQKLQLMLASGDTLPDIVNVSDTVLIGQLIDSGQFMPVDELYEKYAVDIYKNHAEKNPEIWYPYTKDGKRYGIPILEYMHNNDTVIWIREDWMKKLSLPAPATIDDLGNIMEQFKNNNPDGLKPDEVVPLAVALKNGSNGWMAGLDWLFGAYGAVNAQWNKAADAALEYGSIHPGAKQALAKANEWMEKGYISKDSITWDEAGTVAPVAAGTAGIISGGSWLPDWPFPDTKKNVPHAEWKAYPVPAGPDGLIGARADDYGVNAVVLINKNFKHPEAFWLYYNTLLEQVGNPSPGSKFENGFAKGYDWDEKDGQITFNPAGVYVLNFLTGSGSNPYRIPESYFDTFVKLADGQEPSTSFEKLMQQSRKPEDWYAAKVVLANHDVYKKNYFIGAPTLTMAEKWDLLYQSELETYNKIIYGEEQLDSFDKFVEGWKKNGGDQVTQEVNDWFKSVSNN